jgi:hypothetical protein
LTVLTSWITSMIRVRRRGGSGSCYRTRRIRRTSPQETKVVRGLSRWRSYLTTNLWSSGTPASPSPSRTSRGCQTKLLRRSASTLGAASKLLVSWGALKKRSRKRTTKTWSRSTIITRRMNMRKTKSSF